MRRPSEIEVLYLDFDGFFASVEQQVDPRLRGRPVGIVPFNGTTRTCVIACSREAKHYGVKNVMNVLDARALCPDIVLVPQKPDLYRRAHNALISEIAAINPVDAIKSIDERVYKVQPTDRADPRALGIRIKRRIVENVGPWIQARSALPPTASLLRSRARQARRPAGAMATVWRSGIRATWPGRSWISRSAIFPESTSA